MAKTMVRVENGIVVNIEWCSGNYIGDDSLVDVYDVPVGIGDTYDGYGFYRDGVKLLSPTDQRLLNVETSLRESQDQLTDVQIALCDSYEEQMVTEVQLSETQLALCDAYEAQLAAEEALVKAEKQLTETQLALCDVYEIVETLIGGSV